MHLNNIMLALMMYLILCFFLSERSESMASSAWSASFYMESFLFMQHSINIACFMRHTIDFSTFFRLFYN